MGICCTQGNYAFGALLMINVDDFKLYNQLYGDEEGDEALKRIAKIIQEEVTGECHCPFQRKRICGTFA